MSTQDHQPDIDALVNCAAKRGLSTQDLAVCSATIMGGLLEQFCATEADKGAAYQSLLSVVRRHAGMAAGGSQSFTFIINQLPPAKFFFYI